MRIAVVHSYYSSAQPSGENTVVDEQVALLRSEGHDVLLIAERTDEHGRLGSVVSGTLQVASGCGPSPSDSLQQFDPHVILVHNLFPNFGQRWLEQWAPRVVAIIHNYRQICSAATLWRAGNDCDLCLTKSSLQAIKHACYRGSRIATIPLAFATRRAGAASFVLNNAHTVVVLNEESLARHSAIRGERPIAVVNNFIRPPAVKAENERAPSWLYVGRLTREKGITWLQDNWPSDYMLEIIGDGPMRDDVKQMQLASPHRFRYLGKQSREDVIRALDRSQGLIIPSLWSEGLPTVAIEALSRATPLVVSSRCAISDFLARIGASRSVRLDDPESLHGILRDTENDEGAGERAYRAYEEHYSPSAWLRGMQPIFDAVRSTNSAVH